jgi:O-antigen/teichoic acid export membrane protein
LLTRDVAQDRSQAHRYLHNVVALRVGLWLASLPFVFGAAYYYHVRGRLTSEEAQAIAIFIGALFFADLADAVTSVFNAFEKMEYPAGLSTATEVGKVALGGLVLLPPLNLGFVGLSWVSLLMNVVQVIWLYAVMRSQLLPDQPGRRSITLELPLQLQMLRESYPLMINNLFASVCGSSSTWLAPLPWASSLPA